MVATLRYAKAKGAKTIVLVNKADSLMGKEASVVFAYRSKALYILPLADVYLFTLELARLQGNTEIEPIIRDLHKISNFLRRQYHEEKEPAKALTEQLKDETIF